MRNPLEIERLRASVLAELEKLYDLEDRVERILNGDGHDPVGEADPWTEKMKLQARKVRIAFEKYRKVG